MHDMQMYLIICRSVMQEMQPAHACPLQQYAQAVSHQQVAVRIRYMQSLQSASHLVNCKAAKQVSALSGTSAFKCTQFDTVCIL